MILMAGDMTGSMPAEQWQESALWHDDALDVVCGDPSWLGQHGRVRRCVHGLLLHAWIVLA